MSKATARKSVKKKRSPAKGVTAKIPAPPVDNATENLSIEIHKPVGWRLRVALFHLEAEGQPSTKKAFVENAIISALDEFDLARQGGK